MTPFLKRNLLIAAGIVVLIAYGAWSFHHRSTWRSSHLSGPEFLSNDATDLDAVRTNLIAHLKQIGYRKSHIPSTSDSRHHQRFGCVKRESRQQAVFVFIHQDKTAVRTSIEWNTSSTVRKAKLVERDAYRLAIALSDWFAARPEMNELPQEFREKKRADYATALGRVDELRKMDKRAIFDSRIRLRREVESRFGRPEKRILGQKATFSRFSANSSTRPNRAAVVPIA